jgi:hypothetical protein
MPIIQRARKVTEHLVFVVVVVVVVVSYCTLIRVCNVKKYDMQQSEEHPDPLRKTLLLCNRLTWKKRGEETYAHQQSV